MYERFFSPSLTRRWRKSWKHDVKLDEICNVLKVEVVVDILKLNDAFITKTYYG